MKTPIFKDANTQTQFEEDGFVKLKLLSEQEISRLQEIRGRYFAEPVQAFFSSSYIDDFELKSEISQTITSVLEERIKEQFINYRSIGSAFLIKGTGKYSEMPMHQDWTIVDESKYFAVNIWIPLTETNNENGTIEVLRGSHKWNRALRAPTLPFFFEGLQEQIKPFLTQISTVPGEVVVLNQAVVHYSKPNLSDADRPAITSGLVSEEAELIFHFWDKDKNQIEVLNQEDDFLLRFVNFHEAIYKRPLMGESKEFIDYSHPTMSIEELNSFVGVPNEKKKGFFSRILGR